MLLQMPRWLVISLAVVAGCRDPGIADLEHSRDAICACKSAACAETEMKRVPARDAPNNHRAQTIARQMMECLAKLYEAERPATGPDDVPPPSP